MTELEQLKQDIMGITIDGPSGFKFIQAFARLITIIEKELQNNP